MRAVTALSVLLGVNAVLIAALALFWYDPQRRQWTEPAPVPPAIDYNVATSERRVVDVSQFKESLERPLFAATRRRQIAQTQSAETQQEVDPLKEFRLLGVIAAGQGGSAILSHGSEIRRVKAGDTVAGWKLGTPSGTGISLTGRSGETRELKVALVNAAPAGAAVASVGAASTAAVPGGGAVPTRAAAGQRADPPRQPKLNPLTPEGQARLREASEAARRRIEERKARRASGQGSAVVAPESSK